MSKEEARQELDEFMVALSEKYYGLVWHLELEYLLWDGLMGEETPISSEDLELLRQKHVNAGGWFYYPPKKKTFDPVFIATGKWLEIYEKRRRT